MYYARGIIKCYLTRSPCNYRQSILQFTGIHTLFVKYNKMQTLYFFCVIFRSLPNYTVTRCYIAYSCYYTATTEKFRYSILGGIITHHSCQHINFIFGALRTVGLIVFKLYFQKWITIYIALYVNERGETEFNHIVPA